MAPGGRSAAIVYEHENLEAIELREGRKREPEAVLPVAVNSQVVALSDEVVFTYRSNSLVLLDLRRQEVISRRTFDHPVWEAYRLGEDSIGLLGPTSCKAASPNGVTVVSYPAMEEIQRIVDPACKFSASAADFSGGRLALAWSRLGRIDFVAVYVFEGNSWSVESTIRTGRSVSVNDISVGDEWLLAESRDGAALWDLGDGGVRRWLTGSGPRAWDRLSERVVYISTVSAADVRDSSTGTTKLLEWSEAGGVVEYRLQEDVIPVDAQVRRIGLVGSDVWMLVEGGLGLGGSANGSRGLSLVHVDLGSSLNSEVGEVPQRRMEVSFGSEDFWPGHGVEDVFVQLLGEQLAAAAVVQAGRHQELAIDVFSLSTGELLSSQRREAATSVASGGFVEIVGFVKNSISLVVQERSRGGIGREQIRSLVWEGHEFGRATLLDVSVGKDPWGPVPIADGEGVRAFLRKTEGGEVERISLAESDDLLSEGIGGGLRARGGSILLGGEPLGGGLSDDLGRVYALHSVLEGNFWFLDSRLDSPVRFAQGFGGDEFSPDGTHLFGEQADGTISMWRVADGKLVARLITLADGEWAVVAADGRYDASDPADLDTLAWVMPDASSEPVPLAVFYRDYYEPRLLPRLMAGEELPPIRSVAALDRTQPRVAIVHIERSGERSVDVTVEVRESRSEGAQDLKLFRDGVLVGWEPLGPRPPGLNAGRAWSTTFRQVALPTFGAEVVEFSAYAFNSDGVKSVTDRVSFVLPDMDPVPRRAFVISVGVDAYENRSWDLRYAAQDARATGETVARHLRASGDFDEVHAMVLVSEREASGAISSVASRAHVLGALGALAGEPESIVGFGLAPGATSLRKAGPDDFVYFSFSGHGLAAGEGRFHLFLSDIGQGTGRSIDEELLGRTLDSSSLARYLGRVDAGAMVVVIDACNSAASVEGGGGFRPGPMGSRELGQLAYDKGMRIVAASQAEEVALESDRLRHGLLTYALVREGLERGLADRSPADGAVDLGELLAFGVERVPVLYEELRDGRFEPEPRSAEPPFRPTGAAKGATQRPKLFDFARRDWNVRLPVEVRVE